VRARLDVGDFESYHLPADSHPRIRRLADAANEAAGRGEADFAKGPIRRLSCK
jgi:hypothetical protein